MVPGEPTAASDEQAVFVPLEPGARWRERYEPLEVVGHGSQGQVYRAVDHQHGRVVALKVRPVGSAHMRDALLSEAGILLGLRPHAGVPLVRDDFFLDDQYVIVMDWIEGTNLAQVLDRRGEPGLNLGSTLSYLDQVANALDHLHGHSPPIVHGDVKPANCVLTADGRVVLVDFGISSWGAGSQPGTGTRGYMAPEVAGGAVPTPAADVYALAATAFALLAGAAPGADAGTPNDLLPAESRALSRAIRRGLAIDPERRPGSAGDLLRRMRSLHEGDLPTGVVTFLLTDIEGSTGLWDAHPDEMTEALQRHEALVGDAVESHRGRVIKSQGEGDATLSVFARATDAVPAVLALQRSMEAEPWLEGVRVRVRASLHTGEAQLRDGDYFGPTLNRAARLRGVAGGGQVVLSQATYEVVADRLPTGVALRDLGRRQLKGLKRPEQVYELTPLAAGAVPNAANAPSRSPGTVHLPATRTSFVGRTEETTSTRELLDEGRLVTLTGVGGTGKTRLALEVAAQDSARYVDGVFFIDLAPVADPQLVVATVADGVHAQGDPTDLQAMVIHYLEERRALIVLDNCEHVIDAAAEVADLLLRRCPSISILATSREALEIEGEQTFVVPPLATDDDRSAAVELFVVRAQSARSDFQLRDANRADVLAICSHLDGIPLAIELAAARVGHLAVGDINARLDERFALLTGPKRRGAQRHQQTLQAAMDWSWDLLDEPEQRFLATLGVFAGAFTLDAAEAVCADPRAATVIASLVAKSLVVLDGIGDARRYRLLETVRMYAHARLVAAGDLDGRRDAHRDWYLEALRVLSFDELTQFRVQGRVVEEHANHRAALDWSASQGRSDLVAAMVLALTFPWSSASALVEELRRWLQRIADDETQPTTARADAFAALALASTLAGDYPSVHALAERSIALDSTERPYYAWALSNFPGRYEEAGDVAERVGIPTSARAMRAYAADGRLVSAPAEALHAYEELVLGLQPASAGWDQFLAYGGAALARLALDDGRGALADARSLRDAMRGVEAWGGSVFRYASVLEAMALANLGRHERARAVLFEVTDLARRDRYPVMENDCVVALAYLAFCGGDPRWAATLLEPVATDGRLRVHAMHFFVERFLSDLHGGLGGAPMVPALPTADAFTRRTRALLLGDTQPDPATAARVGAAIDDFLRTGGDAVAPSERRPLPSMLARTEQLSFVGRAAELAALNAASHAARLGDRRVVLVAGEPGIGKSTLVGEAARQAHADGATVLFGRCDEDLGVPYQPFVEALSHLARDSQLVVDDLGLLAGELVRLVPELVQRVPDLPPALSAEPETERYRLFEAVAGWLAALSSKAPVVLVLEDLHWGAKPTLLMLRHLLRSTESTKLLVVATYRDTEVGYDLADILGDLRRESGTQQLSLTGLSEAEVAALSGEDATALHASTAGNPFFIQQVLHHQAESGDTGVPEGVRDVLRRRIARLPASTAEALAMAAVTGAAFEPPVVGAALGVPEIEALDALDVAVDAHLLSHQGSRWAFVHDVVRETLVEDLSRTGRAAHHRAIAEALEGIGDIEGRLSELAHHCCEAAPLGEVDRAVDYARRAGDRARELLSMEDAASWYERALVVLDLDPVADEGLRCDLQIALGDALHRAGAESHRAVLVDAGSRARGLSDARRLGEVAVALSNPAGFFGTMGAFDEDLVELAEEALAELPATGEHALLRSRVLSALASEVFVSPEHARRKAMSREAVEIARRVGDAETLGHALFAHYWAASAPDTLDETLRNADELVALGERSLHPEIKVRGLILRHAALVEAADLAGAFAALDEAGDLASQLRVPVDTWMVAFSRAGLALLAGRLVDGERLVNEAAAAGVAADFAATALGQSLWQLALIRVEQGRASEAVDAVIGMATGAPAFPLFLAGQATIEADAGRLEDARRSLTTLEARGHESLPWDYLWLGGTVCKASAVAAVGDTVRATRLYDELAPYAGRNTWVGIFSWGPVDLALGLLAATLDRNVDAEKHFAGSAELCERMGAPTWLARTHCEWAALLSDRGEPERARALATQALVAAEELGMAGVAARARSVLRVPLPGLLLRPDQVAFVGRGAERSALDDAWQSARGGERRAVLVAGEPGIGKSTLAAEIAGAAFGDGGAVLAGRCDEDLGVPYQPFVEALTHLARHAALTAADLGPLAGELVRLVPELAQRVPDLPPALSAEPETERYRLFEAVAGWLAALSSKAPVVLVVEDLHWAAKPTLLMLRHLLRSTESTKLLVVATYRDTEVGDDLVDILGDLRRESGAEQVSLTGLNEAEVVELAGDASATGLHASTAGNPFFVGQLLQHRAESGDTAVPEGVRDVLRRRIARLPASTAEALTMAAVTGAAFEPPVVGAALGVPEIEALDALDVAVDAQLLSHRGSRWAFVHDVVRETLVEDLPRKRRATLHRAIAEAFEATGDVESQLSQLAHHWCGASPLGDVDRAIDYARRAGNRARENLSFEDAASWYQRALDVLDLDHAADDGLRCDLQIALGDALHRAGAESHRPVLLDAAVRARRLGDSRRIGQVAVALSNPAGFFGAFGAIDQELVDCAEKALEGLPAIGDDALLRSRVLSALASEVFLSPEHARRKAMSREAVEIARRVGDVETLAHALFAHHWAASDPDTLEETLRDADELVTLGEGSLNPEIKVRGLIVRHDALVEAPDLAAAVAALDEAEEITAQVRLPVYAWMVAYRRAGLAMLAGHLVEAERLVNEAAAVGTAADFAATALGISLWQLASIRMEQGRASEAVDAVTGMAAGAPALPTFRAGQARIEAEAGRLADARESIAALAVLGHESLPRDYLWLGASVAKARAVAVVGDTAQAGRLYEELAPYAGRNTWVGMLSWGPVDLALGLLAVTLDRTDDAGKHFAASVEVCERMNTPTWLAGTRCEWASMLLDGGERERARALATQALAAAEELGMTGVATTARALLRVPFPPLLSRVERLPFVGRAEERASLDAAWQDAAAGQRRVVLVAGEPGAGKTRLASEFAASPHSDGALVLAGRCDEGMGVPYQPFVEALRFHVDNTSDEELATALGRYPGELVRLVPEIEGRVRDLPVPPASDPETERYRLFDGVASWLAASPMVLVLDDLQWATAPTLLLLRHVVRSPEPRGLLVVTTYRDTEVDESFADILGDLARENGVARLSVAGLDAAEVAELSGAGDASAIHAATAGNPFFVGELLHHRAESDGEQVPTAVSDLVARRIRRLPDGAQSALAIAAVIGEEFDIDVLELAAGISRGQAVDILDAAADARLFSMDGARCRFAHALVRDALRESLSAPRRLDAHRRVGEAIEAAHGDGEPHLPALGMHFAEAGERAKAIDYLRRAGHAAMSRLAYDDAVSHFQRALALEPSTAQRVALLVDAGGAEVAAGDRRARSTLLSAAEEAGAAGETEAQVRAVLAASGGFAPLIIDRRHVAALEAALESLSHEDSVERARLLAELALAVGLDALDVRALGLSDEALAMALRIGDAETIAYVRLSRVHVIDVPDRVEERVVLVDQLAATAAELNSSWLAYGAAIHGFTISLQLGDPAAAEARLAKVEALDTEYHHLRFRWSALALRSNLEYIAGRLGPAERFAEECYAAGESAGVLDAAAYYYLSLWQFRYDQGRLEEVTDFFVAAVETSAMPITAALLGLLYCETGRSDAARPILGRFAERDFDGLPQDAAWLVGAALLASVCFHLRDVAAAAPLRDLLLPYADRVAGHATIFLGSIHHALGLLATTLGDHSAAEDHFAAAAATHERMGSPNWLARTRCEWASMLLHEGSTRDIDRAHELATHALATAEDLGMAKLADDARALLS